MSHVTDVKLKIRDVEALKEACEALGLELQEDKRTYAWWGTFVGDSRSYGEHRPEEMGTCDHAIKVAGTNPLNGSSGPWEIGVVRAKDGDGFGLYYDTYGSAGRALTDRVGPNAQRLKHEYAVAQARRKAQATLARRGWVVGAREDLGNGRTRIKLRKR